MQTKIPTDCPRCGRPLQKFNGHIGFCSQHKWVSPAGLGFEAEAAEQNRQDADAESRRRLEIEKEKADASAQEAQEKHQAAVRKAIIVVLALFAIAALIVFFVVRPSINYSSATKKFQAGDYAGAQAVYEALGSYKDSSSRALLSDAMIDLEEGRTEDAAEKLEQLTATGSDDAAATLSDAILPVITNWKEHGLSAESLLVLLQKMPIIDPAGTVDAEALSIEGHAALLSETVRASYACDVDENGEKELIVLEDDYTVTVYRMVADSNTRISVDNTVSAACATQFGANALEENLDDAVSCFEEAYRLSPTTETRANLTSAYRKRALSYENENKPDMALGDAEKALSTSGASDEFDFLYEMSLRNCKNGHDNATAISMWDSFSTKYATEVRRFGAEERWKADAGQLHIDYATTLAAKKDASCMAELQTADSLGVDVNSAVDEAMTHFEEGLTLTNLRIMAFDLADGDSSRQQSLMNDIAQGLTTAVSDWKSLGIAPAEIPALIKIADEQNVVLTGINRDAVYQEAALAATGQVSQRDFVNWDNDAYQELLTVNADGNLDLYGIGEAWTVVSSIATGLDNPSYVIVENTAPVILVTDAKQSSLLVVTCEGTNLKTVFRETGITRYAQSGTEVTFSRQLEGSIARYNDYAYSATDITERPVRVGIDWQQNDYPAPADASAAVQRYFEARAYDIIDEQNVLTAESAATGVFGLDTLSGLATPDVPGTVDSVAYLTNEDKVLFEVTYPSGDQTIRTWIMTEYLDGWKVVGAADTYGAGLSTEDVDYTLPLISLNVGTENTLSDKGSRNTYRVFLPSAGRVSLLWQSGTKAESRTSHVVTMYHASLTGDVVFSYELQPSPNKQQSKDMFLSAGVYYVTVEAKKADTAPYHLTIVMEAQEHVELESNDTYQSATAIDLNTGYSASLSNSKDVDYFAFTLDEPGAVNVSISSSGNGSKSTVYAVDVLKGDDGGKLSSFSVQGNAQLTETGNLYLSSGTYFVKVAKGSSFTNDEYILSVNVSRDGNMESESNNTIETANAIPVNEDIHASIGQEGDVDCYSFTLTEDAVIQPKFSFVPTDSSSKTYVLTIMDSSRHELLNVAIGGKESTKVIAPVALTAGTYTVKIENPRYVRQDYTLHLVSMAVEHAENEPNDSAGLATDLIVGQARTGVLTMDTDIDYYKVTFAEQTTVTLKFSFAQSTSKNTTFVLSIEQNGKTQWTANIKGDSGGIEQQLQFPAGEYYIKVKPSTWLSTVYTISLE